MKRTFLIAIFLIGCLTHNSQSQCNTARTCGACYDIPNCAWCSSQNFAGVRCFSSDSIMMSMCSMIENRQSDVTLDELELNSNNQISLRKATVNLRVGDTQTVNVSIRPAENYPLDLYLLVDLSFSLQDDLNTIKSIASGIVDAISNISTRFQVGFGTFVDKLTLPYTSNIQLRGRILGNGMLTACADMQQCTLPFSYVHNINLTNDSVSFTNGFQGIEISTNVDDPEGTFDAIFQAALCDEIVGWRPEARKIILVLTDDVTHTAGDGRLAGINRPVPMECLTAYDPENNRYTYVDNLQYDYPSLEQLRQVFSENIIVPVFAVTETRLGLYNTIANALEGTGAVTAVISADSSNIIEVIQTAYENIISNVSLTFPTSPDVTIDYRASCPEEAVTGPNGLWCSNITVNLTTTFELNITLNRCTDNFRKSIIVTVPAYGNFEIEVVGICQCDCESSAVPNSDMCSFNGTASCGVCECNPGWTGDTCNCFGVDDLECPTSSNNAICSGRGDCVCGQCQCNTPDFMLLNESRYMVNRGGDESVIVSEMPLIYGTTCECDNFRCEAEDSVVCSGPNNGNCTCEGGEPMCQCKNSTFGNFPFTGDACECSLSFCFDTSMAYTPDRQPCNGFGMCEPCNPQNPCVCDRGFEPPYCVPFDFQTAACNADDGCVRCFADNEDISGCSVCNTSQHRYFRLNETKPLDYNVTNALERTTTRCTFSISDPICTYVYFIGDNEMDGGPHPVEVQPRSGCSLLRWWQIALILLAVLIIVGILLLAIIKLIFLCLDYAELKTFQKEVAEADLSKNFNPLYQSPEVKYDNVAFGKE